MALLEAAKIPVFTPTPLVPSEYNSADSYVTSGGSQVLFGAQGAAMVSQGAKKIAILSFDIDAAKPLAEFAKKAVIGAGGKVVAEIAVPFQAVDVSSQIQQLKSSGADGALLITTEDIGAMIIRTIGQFGVHVKISASQAGLRRETLDSLGSLADGLIGGASLPVVNVGGKNAPSILPYIKEMKAAGSYSADNVRNFGISSWIAVHAIAMAAKDVTGTVDGPALQSALNASKGYDLPVVGTWVPSKTGPFPTYSRVSNGIGFFLRYEGNGQWATLKPTAGVDTFALVAKADAKAAKAAKAN
jgi:ABC-type branched-subunit amino acid transport system substrate-binding protein